MKIQVAKFCVQQLSTLNTVIEVRLSLTASDQTCQVPGHSVAFASTDEGALCLDLDCICSLTKEWGQVEWATRCLIAPQSPRRHYRSGIYRLVGAARFYLVYLSSNQLGSAD